MDSFGNKPRILVIENSIDVTGALKSIARATNDLKFFFDFLFILPTGSKGRHVIESMGHNVIDELPMKELSKRISSWIMYVPTLLVNTIKLRRLVKRNNISVIHVNDLYNLLPVTMQMMGIRVPYICHVRFLPNRFPSFLLKFWINLHYRYAEKIIAVSTHVKLMLPPNPKIVVIHNELPEKEVHPLVIKKTRGIHENAFLYLSNFIKGKGQDYAIEAFSIIHHLLPDWKLRMAGGDMGMKKNKLFKMKLIERAVELSIANKIEWVEFVELVEWEYKQADIILNFSESESFSITCLEALYYSRPLIATDCGGPSEIINDGTTGILVENRNIDAMANAMLQLATDKKLREKMGTLARETVKEKFSKEKTSFRLGSIYEQIMANR